MTEVRKYVRIRVSEAADSKLSEVAKAERLTKTEALSRIVLSHVAGSSERDAGGAERMKAIMDKLSGIHLLVSKNAGAAERTESFIKGLLRESRVSPVELRDAEVSEAERGTIGQAEGNDISLQALLLLGRVLALGTKGVGFDGAPMMQIKVSMEEFLDVQGQYEQLCMSRNISPIPSTDKTR